MTQQCGSCEGFTGFDIFFLAGTVGTSLFAGCTCDVCVGIFMVNSRSRTRAPQSGAIHGNKYLAGAAGPGHWRGCAHAACPSPGSPTGFRPIVSIWLISYSTFTVHNPLRMDTGTLYSKGGIFSFVKSFEGTYTCTSQNLFRNFKVLRTPGANSGEPSKGDRRR